MRIFEILESGGLRLRPFSTTDPCARIRKMEDFEALENLNITNGTFEDFLRNSSHCGELTQEKFNTIQSCTFWVEGVAMSVLGFFAIVTNIISVCVFSK